ncbi:MAG: PorV/PorQ family protein [Candidatus Desantisbacteria bacterium]
MAVTMSYARRMNEQMSVGANARVIRQRIKNSTAAGLAMDMGILCSTKIKGLNVGVALRNMGTKMKFENEADSLPLEIKGGIAFNMPSKKALCVLDVTIPTDNNIRINTGVEYKLTPKLSLRTGYNSNSDMDKGLSAGIGFGTENLQFDYAFVPYGDVDNTHRVSVGKRF